MSDSTRKICLYAMGVALFVVLTMCVQAPVFENYYLCLGYVAMAVYCFSFGPAAGAVVGSLGVIIYCLLTSGLRGMPGWALGNVVLGLMTGCAFYKTKNMKNRCLCWVINAVLVIFSAAIGILGVKSALECILYGQPFAFRAAKNGYAFVADAVILLASLPICGKLDIYLHRYREGKQ